MNTQAPSLLTRIETEIDNYYHSRIEISPDVFFSQYKTIKRIYKFRNKYLTDNKIKPDLSYDYYFDIISPRVDSEVKNLRFDTKNILTLSTNPIKDFAAVFISNTQLKLWMADNGEDDKLKESVEEFVCNGNVGFKKVSDGYDFIDPLNTIITNQKAKSINDTDHIERHELTASQLLEHEDWDNLQSVIDDCGNKFFLASKETTQIETTSKRYEVFEFTGQVSEKEFNEVQGKSDGDSNKFFLAKVVVAGLSKGKKEGKQTLFAEKFPKGKKMDDYYIYAHRGRFTNRFWREGLYEALFDHQIRANDIGNQLASALDWSSKIIFKSPDSQIMQNIKADMENGDVIQAKDINQLEVRSQAIDQLIADWNRLMSDADKVANSFEVVRGENLPSGTAFRLGVLMDENAGKMFTLLRQKITMPYQRVFKNWVLPTLVRDLKGEDIFRITGDALILEKFREIAARSWYMRNLVQIGPHTSEIADAIIEEKIDELRNLDPTIENSKEIWDGVLQRFIITITGENSDIQDQLQDIINLLGLEQDPERISWMLDQIYAARGIPVPPRKKEEPAPTQLPERQSESQLNQPTPEQQAAQQQVR